MQIELNQELVSIAKAAALSSGYESVSDFISAAVKEKAESGCTDTTPSESGTHKWIDKLYALGSKHKAPGYQVDDSRESIYPDRL